LELIDDFRREVLLSESLPAPGVPVCQHVVVIGDEHTSVSIWMKFVGVAALSRQAPRMRSNATILDMRNY
jgi:hypothetical protein